MVIDRNSSRGGAGGNQNSKIWSWTTSQKLILNNSLVRRYNKILTSELFEISFWEVVLLTKKFCPNKMSDTGRTKFPNFQIIFYCFWKIVVKKISETKSKFDHFLTPIYYQKPSRGGPGVIKFWSKMRKSSFYRTRSRLCRIQGTILTLQSHHKNRIETYKIQGSKKTFPWILQDLVE